jgi:hypothetical protein
LRREIDNDGKLISRLANFGHIQYGSSFVATIFYAESKDVRLACNLDLILEDKGL